MEITLAQARSFFPNADSVVLHDIERGLHHALDAEGKPIGTLLATSPETDGIIGYSGPSNILVALDESGAVAGVELISSADTPEHVELITKDKTFFKPFLGWKPSSGPPPAISAVSGATLTSYAMAESLAKRLAGASASLRFPETPRIDEIKILFPEVKKLETVGRRLRVVGSDGKTLGYVLRTSPEADNVSGYRGPTDLLVGISPDGLKVTALKIRKSFDTEDYVEIVRDDEDYLRSFSGRTVAEIANLDYKKEGIEGVSGATQTSWAIAEGLKRRLAAEVATGSKPTRNWFQPNDWAFAGVVAGALLLAFSPLRGKRWLRLGWLGIMIGYVGLAGGGLLSLSLFQGWATHGPAWQAAPGLVLLGLAALILPWATRRQVYCHQICPHGAAQQFLGALGRKMRSRSRTSPARALSPYFSRLESIPALLLAGAVIAILLHIPVNLALIEPFDAWVWQAAGTATITIAIIGLAASFFIPQAYCRFGCPTGALFNFLRSFGSGDRWGARDWAALGLLAAGLLCVGFTRITVRSQPDHEVTALSGKAMGSSWSVKIRGLVPNPKTLENEIKAALEHIEQTASNWRENSTVSVFNHSTSHAPTVSPELASLARVSQRISQESEGALDITIAPLVRLWGFGPGPRRDTAPKDAEIEALRSRMGWNKLTVAEDSLTKQIPDLEIDVSSVTEGWTADHISKLLKSKGLREYLVEISGEMRVAGQWNIAIEHPARVCALSNESLATSGTYRQNWKAEGKTFSHLIDPRTGKPVTHDTVSVSVRHSDCVYADGWSTALNVLGVERGLPLAERLGLAVQFVIEKNGQYPEVRSSSAWK